MGTGHVYQGRYKSFPVETDEYFSQAMRYVERNALRANLVERAEDWRWSNLWRRRKGSSEQKGLLSAWPLEIPRQMFPWQSAAGGLHADKPEWHEVKEDEAWFVREFVGVYASACS